MCWKDPNPVWAQSEQLRLILGFLRGDIPIQQTTKTARFGVVYASTRKSCCKHFQAETCLSECCVDARSVCISCGIRWASNLPVFRKGRFLEVIPLCRRGNNYKYACTAFRHLVKLLSIRSETDGGNPLSTGEGWITPHGHHSLYLPVVSPVNRSGTNSIRSCL